MRRTWSLGIAVIAVAGLAAAVYSTAGRYYTSGTSYTSSQDRASLIRFSHQKHITGEGVECSACHGGVEKSTAATENFLGTMAACYACHDQETTECSFCHKEAGPNYTAFAPTTREIKFNHALHVDQGLKCEQCHAGLDQTDFSTPTSFPGMAACMGCHDGTKASNECAVCHSDASRLRPVSHTPEWLHRHNTLVRVEEQNCAMCHGVNDCQECHEGAILVEGRENAPDHFAPFAPTASAPKKPLILERVHSLDYRSTHGLDARGKERDCQTCHEPATFCAECHRVEGNVNEFKPQWHGGPDWGAIAGGVGSGGGRHAELARRDLENCAACHDVQGEDPTCLACHMDRTPGLGSDPRTHEPGYMHDVHGSWHSDLDETCYACHSPSPFSSPGFCTYCHGPKDSGESK
jgi:hypothetical protein